MEIQDLDGATNDQMGQIFKSSDRRHGAGSVLHLEGMSETDSEEADSPGEELLKRKKTITAQSL